MSQIPYHFGKIHDLISDPQGFHAPLIDWHINAILDRYKDSDNIDAMKQIASELKEYFSNPKLKTKDYAHQLTDRWKNLCSI